MLYFFNKWFYYHLEFFLNICLKLLLKDRVSFHLKIGIFHGPGCQKDTLTTKTLVPWLDAVSTNDSWQFWPVNANGDSLWPVCPALAQTVYYHQVQAYPHPPPPWLCVSGRSVLLLSVDIHLPADRQGDHHLDSWSWTWFHIFCLRQLLTFTAVVSSFSSVILSRFFPNSTLISDVVVFYFTRKSNEYKMQWACEPQNHFSMEAAILKFSPTIS